MLALPTDVKAAEPFETLDQVLALCSDINGDADAVHAKLLELGWTPTEGPDAVYNIAFWNIFARDFAVFSDDDLQGAANSEDRGLQLGYLIENVEFLTASMLGNSALSLDQPSYEKDDFRLATLGLGIGRGYCIMSGPERTYEHIDAMPDFEGDWPRDVPKSDRPGVTARFGEFQSARVLAAKYDDTLIRELFGAQDIDFSYRTRAFDMQFFDDMPASTFHISPKRTR